jgi:uncharacterized protein YcbX
LSTFAGTDTRTARMRVHLGRILVYPIKSLDGVEVEESKITPGGILEHDRAYAVMDELGKVVNGKRTPRIHGLRCQFDAAFSEVYVGDRESGAGVQCGLADPGPLNGWLSGYFGFPVTLHAEPNGGFPDDREASGPTIVGLSSLVEVAGWFPGLDLLGVRRRFRSNLELEGVGVPPFWEDGLFGEPGTLKPFAIGDVRISGHNPCQRCVVPTRDPDTATGIPGFQKEFMERRRQSLPSWAASSRFNHFYRFAVNTSIGPSEAGKVLRVGDLVAQAATP